MTHQHRANSLGLVSAFVLALVLVWTAVAPPAAAQYFGRNKVQYDQFDFRVLSTDHFDIHFYPEAEEGVRDAARMAERWHTRLSTILGHEFRERKPIIFYADDADFRQTNVIGGQIGEGVQGVTEGFRQRVVMPLTGSYADTDHVLGHELIHQFQYDISQRAGQFNQFIRMPLWMIEGMAEYFSVGRSDAHTAMWLRDAIIRDAFPTLEQLSRDPRFFPYRYGQAFWAWVGGTYGDEAAVQLFRSALAMPIDSAIVRVTGLTADSLGKAWEQGIAEAYLPLVRGRQAPPYRGRDLAAADPERLVELGLVALAGERILARDVDAGDVNVAPKVSPDGRYVAFLSERDLFGIDLFLADAQTGRVIKRLQSVGTDPHLDAIRFLDSAGTWSPDGQRFAFVTYVQGSNEIAILDVATQNITRRIQVTGVGAIKDPTWSPDGRNLAFTGIRGGIANLYMVDIDGGAARQLTDDRHADLQATWSPDGRRLAFATDRGPGTSFERLTFSPLQLAFFDVEENEVEVLEIFPAAKHINPQFSPDGDNLYFVSDHGGISNVFRLHLPTGDIFQITDVATGISGITATSPTFSVASQSGLMMYSVFEAQAYNVYSLRPDQAVGELVRSGDVPPLAEELPATEPTAPLTPDVADLEDPLAETVPDEDEAPLEPEPIEDIAIEGIEDEDIAEVIPPADRVALEAVAPVLPDTLEADEIAPRLHEDVEVPVDPPAARDAIAEAAVLGVLPPGDAALVSRVERYLAAYEVGLPDERDFPDRPYRARLALDYITQPQAGIGYDQFSGFGFGGGIAMRFSDMLGDHILGAVIQASGTIKDIGGQGVYLNQRQRLNWGVTAGHVPFLQVFFTDPRSGIVRVLQRTFITQAGGLAAYPLTQTRRFEANVGVRRIAYGFEVDFIDQTGRVRRTGIDSDEAAELFGFPPDALEAIYLGEGGAAYVGDYSFFGFTSPVRGGRYRFGMDATVGNINFATATADYRRYLFSRPFTLAFRGLHYGRYGPDADSNRLFPLFLGFGSLVRGYALNSFDQLTQQQASTTLNQLYGTRLAVANVELRMPFLGTREFGLIDFPYLPTDLALFADAGMVWGQLGGTFVGGQPLGRPFGDARPVFSAGASARVNMLGALIFEFYYALAFNRADDRLGILGINFTPGW